MRLFSSWPSLAYGLLFLTSKAYAVDLDPDDIDSIKNAAATIAFGMMSWYTGNNTGDNIGNVPSPYYWWEGGAMFGAMVDYWYYTNDTSYNDVVKAALISQIGDDDNFMPENQTKSEGNDDQSFWGMSAMSAAELNFTNPEADEPGWLALAQGVFNSLALRWDSSTCGGGLRWQIYTFNTGYDYKNSIANGGLFNLGARLAVYTGNDTYAQWATKTYDWVASVGLIGSDYEVYDGTTDTDNCTSLDHIQWSYNSGIYLLGAANMWKYTNGSAEWEERVWGILNATEVFFSDNIMYESACETNDKCNVDEASFKAHLARWMAATAKVAPFTHDTVMARLRPTAIAAAAQCTGSTPKTLCGMSWLENGTNDGSSGIGEMMCALQAVQALLIDEAPEQVTNETGGTSVGNNAAGTSTTTTTASLTDDITITTAGRVGAGFLTTFAVLGVLSGTWFVILE